MNEKNRKQEIRYRNENENEFYYQAEKVEAQLRNSQRKRLRKRKRKSFLIRLMTIFVLFIFMSIGFMLLIVNSQSRSAFKSNADISDFFITKKPYTIGIDAGHGGRDIGAEGIIDEVDLINPTVHELVRLFKEDGRFEVVQSRRNNDNVSIDERNEIFQDADPDIVISIHGNASEDSSAYGFECFPAPPNKQNHNSSMELAYNIAAEMKKLGVTLRGDSGIRFAYFIPISESGEETNHKKVIVNSSDTTINEYDTFGILENMDCPTVLVEQGFVTNSSDVALLGRGYGMKNSAKAYYNAITNYLESLEIEKETS